MAELPEHERGKVQVSDPKEVEDIVVEGLQASTAHPPLFAASKHEEEIPEPLSRMTSALSTDHIIGDDLGHRRRGFRAWLHDKKTSIKTNFFGIMQRLHAPASVAIAMREASPEERKELVALIDDALEHAKETDASTLAGLYTVTASNHNTEGFQVRGYYSHAPVVLIVTPGHPQEDVPGGGATPRFQGGGDARPHRPTLRRSWVPAARPQRRHGALPDSRECA